MPSSPLLSRLASVLLGILGAASCAVAVVLFLGWMMDQSGPTSSAGFLLGSIVAAALGAALLILSRMTNPNRVVERDDDDSLAHDEFA